AYLAIGQSTKETAYALGISDATVRVLMGRAAAKLGVKTRRDMLEHPEVRTLVPAGEGPAPAGLSASGCGSGCARVAPASAPIGLDHAHAIRLPASLAHRPSRRLR